MRRHLKSTRPELNITSMLDVVLNLVFFFLLITNFAAAERVPMNVPSFSDSLAKEPTEPDKVVINVLPNKSADDIKAELAQGKRPVVGVREIVFGAEQKHIKPGETVEAVIGGSKQTVDKLQYLLEAEVKRDKKVLVSIRVDKSIMYGEIPAILQKVAEAGVTKIDIAATVSKESGK
jgi:biopolymer transport protein ExbD